MVSLLLPCCIPPVYFGLFVVLFFFLIYIAFTHKKNDLICHKIMAINL